MKSKIISHWKKYFFSRKIDVFIGALSENIVTQKYLRGSSVYYQDLLTWCVQIKHLIPKGESLFYMCHDWRVFLTMSLSAFVAIAVTYVIQQFDDIHPKWDWHRITMLCYVNMCGFPSNYSPNITASRINYGVALFGCLLFVIVFGVHCQLFMTNRIYEKQVNTVDELIANDYSLAGDSVALKHLCEQNEVYKHLLSK